MIRCLMYEILKNGVVIEKDFCNKYRISILELKKLIEKSIYIVIMVQGGLRSYILNVSFLDRYCEMCDKCKFLLKNKVTNNDKKVTIRQCTVGVNNKEIYCSNALVMKMMNACKLLGKEKYEQDVTTYYFRKKIWEKQEKRVKDWNIGDFADYVLVLYKEHYSRFIAPDKNTISYYLKTVYKGIRKLIEDKRKSNTILKYFLKKSFMRLSKKGKRVNFNYLIGSDLDRTIADFPIFCKEKDIYCSYMINGDCYLLDKQQRCTEYLRNVMEEKYN